MNFETEKSEIGPENTFRVAPETENFPKNRIFRPENFRWSSGSPVLHTVDGRRER